MGRSTILNPASEQRSVEASAGATASDCGNRRELLVAVSEATGRGIRPAANDAGNETRMAGDTGQGDVPAAELRAFRRVAQNTLRGDKKPGPSRNPPRIWAQNFDPEHKTDKLCPEGGRIGGAAQAISGTAAFVAALPVQLEYGTATSTVFGLTAVGLNPILEWIAPVRMPNIMDGIGPGINQLVTGKSAVCEELRARPNKGGE
jgi:hypothetical protein